MLLECVSIAWTIRNIWCLGMNKENSPRSRNSSSFGLYSSLTYAEDKVIV